MSHGHQAKPRTNSSTYMKTIFSSLLLSAIIGLGASGCGGGGGGSGSSTPVPPAGNGGNTGTVVSNWTTRINNTPLRATASSPVISVAVGSGGFTKWSVNGTEWTIGTTGTNNDLRAIAWSGSRFVTVGDAGTILSSPDGVHWSASASAVSARLSGVTWSASKSLFVAVGGDGGSSPAVILTSPDGLAWSARSAGTNLPLVSVTWAGTQFVAVSSSSSLSLAVSLTSPNGTDWTVHATTIDSFTSVGSSDTQIVAGGANKLYTSSDGITWTQCLCGPITNIFGVAWSGNKFVAVGGSVDSDILTSTDGINWDSQTVPPPTAFDQPRNQFGTVGSVSWSGKQFIATADGGLIITSPDGVTWTNQSSGSSQSLAAATWTGSQYIAVGAELKPRGISRGAIYTSPDAITWTHRDAATDMPLYSIAQSPTRLVAVGAIGAIVTSTNGVDWTSVGDPNSTINAFQSVIWAGNQFVAVGGRNGVDPAVVATSPDGIQWTVRDLPAEWGTILQGVAWNGSQFVAVGWSGVIITSPDAVTWTLQPKLTSFEGYSDVVWSGSQFVAAGLFGSIITSRDGFNWTKREEPGAPYSYERLTWTGKQFVAVGAQNSGSAGTGSDPTLNSGIIRTSPDGVTWTTQVNGGINFLYGVAASNDKVVAVGAYGVVLTSP